jgi:hypothetical protein
MQIDSRDEQHQNADSPKIEILPFDSNVTFNSLLQELKHELAILSADDGMQID